VRADNYTRYLAQYREGIIPVEVLITAFNDLMAASASLSQARAAAQLQFARININNRYK
jgi:hypothetical protein